MNIYGRGDRKHDRVTSWGVLTQRLARQLRNSIRLGAAALLASSALFGSLSHADSTAYDYDELGRLKTVVYPNAVRMDYGLDGTGNRTVVTTRPAEGVLGFNVSSTAIGENGGTVDINISRTNGTTGTVGATLSFGGTAAGGGTDYSVVQPAGTTITLAPGVTSATVRLTIIDDRLYEVPDETIVLTLSSPTGGALLGARARHTLTIGNNDAPPDPDQTPPTAPGNVAALARGTTRVEVVWSSATDTGGSELALYIVERCTGATCTDFSAIGSKPLNGGEFPSDNYSYIDSTVSGSTTYRYRVYARDGAGNEGPYGGPANTTTPDLAGPTVPGTLEASSSDLASVTLHWGESEDTGGSGVASYRIERCVGTGCTVFTELAAVTITTYTDTDVSGSQVYRYRVRARDGAGNNSTFTNIVSITPSDRQGPYAPTDVVATPQSSSFVGISWTAPGDPGGSGVQNYYVERCVGAGCTTGFVELEPITTTAHTIDYSVAGGTSYGYRVRARDGAGNYGEYSAIGRTITPARTPPTTPANLTAVGRNVSTIEVNWRESSATDGSEISLYVLERCTGATCTDFVAIGNKPPNSGEFPSPIYSYLDTSLAPYTTYRYRVRARDGSGTYSEYSNIDDGTTPDLNPPGAPGTLSANAAGASVSLTWGAASDTGGSGIASYRIERCSGANCSFAEIGSTTGTSYTDTSVASSTAYQYRVRARDGAANDGSPTNTVTVTTADFEGPTAPGGLSAPESTSTNIWLTWTASTDPGGSGVQSYYVERCTGASCTMFTEIGTSTSVSYNDLGLDGSTTYRYRVRARDGVGNYGSYTTPINATTPARTPPTTPGNLAALARDTNRVEVIWTASNATDGSGIALYVVERCTGSGCTNFTAIGSLPPNGGEFPSATHSYNDTTVSGWTTYRYQVRARDGSGTYSSYSNIGATTTPDLAAPSAPGNLQITSPNSNTMNLSWVASTEYGGSGLAAYHIERCTGSTCTVFNEVGQSTTNSYSDTTVAGTTAYRYQVRARDNAGNYSVYSNIQSLATSDTIAPNAPTNFTATSPNSSIVNLSWTAPFDGGGSGLSHYTVERCTGAGCTDFSAISCFVTQTYCDDTSVAGGVTYRYQVRAIDHAGNVGPFTAPVSVTTPVGTPSTPSISISAGPVSTSTPYTVSWSASSGATLYELYRSFNGNSFSLFYSGTATSRSQASSAGSWTYQVRACNGSLCSAFSSGASIEVCGAGGCN